MGMSFDLGSPIGHSTPGHVSQFGPPSIVLSDSSSGDIVFSVQSETLVAVGSSLEWELSIILTRASIADAPDRFTDLGPYCFVSSEAQTMLVGNQSVPASTLRF